MYISRIELDTNRFETKRAVISPQILHSAIENCFSESEKTRKLWRLDSLREKEYLLLLSRNAPDFSGFIRQFCAEGTKGETKDYNALLDRVQAGQERRFRLRGNTVHSAAASDERKRGKIYPHVTTEQKKGWLLKKAESNGFEINGDDFDVTRTDDIRFRHGHGYVSLGIADFEGVLKISDAEKFKTALIQGVGRAKAYGCGFLTVAKD